MNIAIIRRNGLGDLLCAFPLITHLREKYRGCHITLFVDERNAPLIPYLPKQERVVVIPKKGNKYLNLFKIARCYRKENFDLAISAKTSPMKLMNFFLYFLGAKKSIAVVDKRWHSRLVSDAIPYVGTCEHQALKGVKLVSPTIKTLSSRLYPHISLDVKRSDKVRILLSASTTRPESRFDPKRYAELVNELGAVEVMVVGQPQDRERAEKIRSHLRVPHVLNFPRNFDDFMVSLASCDLFFVGDGGIAHIGAALRKQMVVLYGITHPDEWGPLSEEASIFYHPKDVNELDDTAIRNELQERLDNVRNNRNGELRCDSCESLPAQTPLC